MATIKSTGTHRPRKPRAKAIDIPTHKALAAALARTVAHANVGHHDRANEAAAHLVHILRAHGIEPKKMSVAP
jgi:hypothetical protein